MVKRKDFIVSDEDEAIETSEEERPTKKAASKGKAKAKKPRFDEDESEESEEERPMKKQKQKQKQDTAKSSSTEEAPSGEVKMNHEGERYIDLGKKKRVTVRSFKGATFIDIREYYGAEGDEKPGKKGITLSPEQWEAMKSNIDSIDWMLRKIKK